MATDWSDWVDANRRLHRGTLHDAVHQLGITGCLSTGFKHPYGVVSVIPSIAWALQDTVTVLKEACHQATHLVRRARLRILWPMTVMRVELQKYGDSRLSLLGCMPYCRGNSQMHLVFP